MSRRILLALVLLLLAVLIFPNARALYEGVFFYLRDVVTYNPPAVTPVSRDGRYASVYDLAHLRNGERRAYILQRASRLRCDIHPVACPK